MNTINDNYADTALQYVYIIRLREFVRLNEPTYKIGKTTLLPHKRLGSYPKNSKIHAIFTVNNCHVIKQKIINKFKEIFRQRTEYGTEYFSGSLNYMIFIMFYIIYGSEICLQECSFNETSE